jgi:hypothetical protein
VHHGKQQVEMNIFIVGARVLLCMVLCAAQEQCLPVTSSPLGEF